MNSTGPRVINSASPTNSLQQTLFPLWISVLLSVEWGQTRNSFSLDALGFPRQLIDFCRGFLWLKELYSPKIQLLNTQEQQQQQTTPQLPRACHSEQELREEEEEEEGKEAISQNLRTHGSPPDPSPCLSHNACPKRAAWWE